MKTIFLLSALAAAVLAAPSTDPLKPGPGPLGEVLPDTIKREKKSFGSTKHGAVGLVPVAVVPVQHGYGAGHVGLHHNPGFGHHSLHRPHYLREADLNEHQLETEAIISTRSAEIKEGKSDMEKSLTFAKAAVDNLERDMLKIEGNQHARMQWKNSDVASDMVLHENIQKAKEALVIARKSFDDLESANKDSANLSETAPQSTAAVQPFLAPVTHETKVTEKQRLAQWKENVDSIHTNGKPVLADARSMKPEDKDDVFQTKSVHEMESSASTNKEVFPNMDKEWHHDLQSSDMKSADDTTGVALRNIDLESAVRAAPNLKPTSTSQLMPSVPEMNQGHGQRMTQLKENIDIPDTNVRANVPLSRSMKIPDDKEIPPLFETKNAHDVVTTVPSNHEAISQMDSKWQHDLKNADSPLSRSMKLADEKEIPPFFEMKNADDAKELPPFLGMKNAADAKKLPPFFGMKNAADAKESTPFFGMKNAADAKEIPPFFGMKNAADAKESPPFFGMKNAADAKELPPFFGMKNAADAKELPPNFEMKNAHDVVSSASSNHEAMSELDSKWQHHLHDTKMKAVDVIPDIEHQRASGKTEMKSFDPTNIHDLSQPMKIQTTDMRSRTDDLNLKNRQHMMTPTMKAAESIQQTRRPMHNLNVPQRHDLENIHEAELNHKKHSIHGSVDSHASAKSSENFELPHHVMMNNEHTGVKSAEIDFMRQALAEKQWKNMHQMSSARSYGGGYGSGLGGGSAGALVSSSGSGVGASAGPAVGVFPNAHVGGCALPLLLSCSPSVSSGHLAHAAPAAQAAPVSEVVAPYGAPSVGAAVYSPASAYRSVDHLNLNKKRDTMKFNKVKLAKKTDGPILQRTKIIQSIH